MIPFEWEKFALRRIDNIVVIKAACGELRKKVWSVYNLSSVYLFRSAHGAEGGCKLDSATHEGSSDNERGGSCCPQLKPLCKRKSDLTSGWPRRLAKSWKWTGASGQEHADRSGTTIYLEKHCYPEVRQIRLCRTALPCRTVSVLSVYHYKKNLSPLFWVVWTGRLCHILSRMKEANRTLPLVIIGGITCEDQTPAIPPETGSEQTFSRNILQAWRIRQQETQRFWTWNV